MGKIIGIICTDNNGVIANPQGKLPWDLPSEMDHFKNKTMGNLVIMGRKTYESTGYLKGRINCIVGDKEKVEFKSWVLDIAKESIETTKFFDFLEAAICYGHKVLSKYYPIYIIGGAQLLSYAIEKDLVSEVYWTEIQANYKEKGSHLIDTEELFNAKRFPYILSHTKNTERDKNIGYHVDYRIMHLSKQGKESELRKNDVMTPVLENICTHDHTMPSHFGISDPSKMGLLSQMEIGKNEKGEHCAVPVKENPMTPNVIKHLSNGIMEQVNMGSFEGKYTLGIDPVTGKKRKPNNSVDHYSNGAASIDVMTFLEMQGITDMRIMNAVKYLIRAGRKINVDPKEDYKKAMNYTYRMYTALDDKNGVGSWLDFEKLINRE